MQSYSTLKSKSTTATISGLKPATRYIFQVRARTSAGCGRFSQTVEVETGKPGECVQVRGVGSVGQGAWGLKMPFSMAPVPLPHREGTGRHVPPVFQPAGIATGCIPDTLGTRGNGLKLKQGSSWIIGNISSLKEDIGTGSPGQC